MAKMAKEWLDDIDPVSAPKRACMKKVMQCKYDHFGAIYLPTKFGRVWITQKKVIALLKFPTFGPSVGKMAIAMATGHLGPKNFSQVKANYICSNIGPMGTLAATSQLSVSGNQGEIALLFPTWNFFDYPLYSTGALVLLSLKPHASASLIFIRIHLSKSITEANNSSLNNFLVKMQLI